MAKSPMHLLPWLPPLLAVAFIAAMAAGLF